VVFRLVPAFAQVETCGKSKGGEISLTFNMFNKKILNHDIRYCLVQMHIYTVQFCKLVNAHLVSFDRPRQLTVAGFRNDYVQSLPVVHAKLTSRHCTIVNPSTKMIQFLAHPVQVSSMAKTSCMCPFSILVQSVKESLQRGFEVGCLGGAASPCPL